MKRKLSFLGLLLVLCLTVVGCSSEKFNAEGFIDGDIKSAYLNVHTEEYMDLLVDETTVEELKEVHESIVWQEVEYFFGYCEIEAGMLTDEMIDEYFTLFSNILSKLNYEVVGSEEANGNFFVDVEVSPIDIVQKAITDEFMSDLIDRYIALEVETIEEAEIFYAEEILARMNEHYTTLGYYPTQTINIKLEDKVNYYEVDQNDAIDFNMAIIAYEDYSE